MYGFDIDRQAAECADAESAAREVCRFVADRALGFGQGERRRLLAVRHPRADHGSRIRMGDQRARRIGRRSGNHSSIPGVVFHSQRVANARRGRGRQALADSQRVSGCFARLGAQWVRSANTVCARRAARLYRNGVGVCGHIPNHDALHRRQHFQ